jgi:hypothetical protein
MIVYQIELHIDTWRRALPSRKIARVSRGVHDLIDNALRHLPQAFPITITSQYKSLTIQHTLLLPPCSPSHSFAMSEKPTPTPSKADAWVGAKATKFDKYAA